MDWQNAKRRFCAPPFASLREPLEGLLDDAKLPGCARLNECATGVKNFRGQQIRFVANAEATPGTHYETRIAKSGEIAMRDNWHDFFNALSWLSFPKAKGAVSEMHARLLLARGEMEMRTRSTPRDVLTLFDESGMVVTSTNPLMLDYIRRFEWKTLFVECREDLAANMRFHLFGHSMLEKALAPYPGVTAKAILLLVDEQFLTAHHAAQMRYIDRRVAAWLMDENNLSSAKNFSPLPWLGVPGWCEENAFPAFYDNTHYFRGGRLRHGHPQSRD